MMRFTNCKTCSKQISYKTHKPILCKECKNKKPAHMSKTESYVFSILDKTLPQSGYIDQGFYSFLVSPKGTLLQLDRYYPRWNLAFEVQGKQHYKYSEHYHKSEANFKYLQECDELKRKICKEKGITLIEVPYYRKLTVESLPLEIKAVNPDLYQKLWGK